MNKNELKEIYLKGGMESLLKSIDLYLPVNMSRKAVAEFRAKIDRELVEMEKRAEESATKVTS